MHEREIDMIYYYINIDIDYQNFLTKDLQNFKNVKYIKSINACFTGVTKALFKIHFSHRINSIFNLPGKSFWNKYYIQNKSQKPCRFIFNGDYYYLKEFGLFDYLKQRYPQSALIMNFYNPISYYTKQDPNFDLEYFIKNFDLLLTYNEVDVEWYGLTLARQIIPCFQKFEENKKEKKDVFFVGRNKGRLEDIISVYEICTNAGLKCDFHITDVPINCQKYAKFISYNRTLSYEKVLEHVANSHCVLNIIQDGASGITLRDIEAIGLGKMIITNNKSIEKMACYDPEMVIWIDELRNKVNDLKKTKKDFWKNKSQYSWGEWLNFIETELLHNKK